MGDLKTVEITIYCGEGTGAPLHYSCLEIPMDGGGWWAAVHAVVKDQTRLSNFTFTFHFHSLEKEMATYSSVLDWRIPGTEKPGRLPSTGSHRVGHDWHDLAAAAARSIYFLKGTLHPWWCLPLYTRRNRMTVNHKKLISGEGTT